uniref:Uncharacterized protein n=1 Tax=Oryza brachyantha TaxID=4533 RepID=J3L036_ORYBR
MSGGLRIFNGDDDSKFAIAHEKNIRNEQSQKEATTLTGWRSISRRNAQKVTDSTAAAVPVKPNDLTLRPEEIRAIQALTGELKKRKLHWLDGVHAFFTAVVFLSVAFSDVGLQKCLFPHAGRDTMELLKNMPLGMSFLSSFVFMIFPTTRHGIGFHGSDNSTSSEVGGPKPEGENKIDSAMAVYLKKEEEKKMNSSVVIEVETEEEDEISSSDVPGSNASSRTVADPEDIKAPRLAFSKLIVDTLPYRLEYHEIAHFKAVHFVGNPSSDGLVVAPALPLPARRLPDVAKHPDSSSSSSSARRYALHSVISYSAKHQPSPDVLSRPPSSRR